MIVIVPLLIGMVLYVVFEARRSGGIGVEPALVTGRGTEWRAVLALARVETKRLVRTPLMLVGIAMYLFAGFVIGVGRIGVLHVEDATLGILFFPLAGMALLATNLAVLRGRRDGAEELFGTMPLSRDARTFGHLGSAVGAFGIGLVLLAIQLVVMIAMGATSTPDVAELLVGPLLVACAAVVGVSAARIVPSSIIGFVALVLMGIMQGLTDHFAGVTHNVAHWFSFWVAPADGWPSDLLGRRAWPHLAYLIALGAFAAVMGFLRHRRDRTVLVALGLTLLLASSAGFAQSRPRPESEWVRVAAFMLEPARFQTCVTHAEVRYCGYEGYEGVRERWIPVVSGVLSLVPERVRSRLVEVSQRAPLARIAESPPEVRARFDASLDPNVSRPDDGAIHPSMEWCTRASCALSLGVLAAARLVGLPTRAHVNPKPGIDESSDPSVVRFDASDTPRAVIALWLGAASSPATTRHLIEHVTHPRADLGEEFSGPPEAPVPIEGCAGVDETGTVYGRGDLDLAAQLLRKPRAQVAGVVGSNWDRLTAPRAPMRTLLDLFDLRTPSPPVGYFAIC